MYTCSLIQSSNQIEACSKITKSEFSANMHICTLCPRYQQILPKFGAAVEEELRKQTVHCEIQIHGQNSNFKRDENYRKIKESELSGNMHIYTLCPKYLQSFTEFRTAVWEELHLQKVLTDWPTDGRFKNITVF